jgi:hypothetical protein
VDWEPLRALLPDQAPEAVQAVALVEDHVRDAALPRVIELGAAFKLTVGADPRTETIAVCAALPPGPEQVRVYASLALSAPVDCEPLRALFPDQAPDAVQAVAWLDDHVKVALAPLVMALGPTLRLTVGSGALTETVVDCTALPAGPTQVSV